MNPSTKTVLIVEDDKIIADIYKRKFEKAGFKVEIAADGQSGFYRIHELKPSVVLLDLMLPQINGVDILRKIRAQKRFEKLPVFVFTNAYMSDYAQEAVQAGANHVFNKSKITPQHIIDAVNAHFQQGKATFQLANESPSKTASSKADQELLSNLDFREEELFSDSSEVTSAFVTKPNAMSSVHVAPRKDDRVLHAQLVREFVEKAPALVREIRKEFHSHIDDAAHAYCLQPIFDLYRKVHGITSSSAISGRRYSSQLCAATEALLMELHENPENLTTSTVRTISVIVEDVTWLLQNSGYWENDDPAPTCALVVENDSDLRERIVTAIDNVKIKAIGVGCPQLALDLVGENNFDLIVVNTQLPDMNGLDFFANLRVTPRHQETPVVFVTDAEDFEEHASGYLSSYCDLVAKPFLPIEVGIKVMSFLLRKRANAPRETKLIRVVA